MEENVEKFSKLHRDRVGKKVNNGQHPNSRKNLKPFWPKGTSGSPKGHPPKKLCLTSIINDLAKLPPEGETKTREELLGEVLWAKAIAGNMVAVEMIWNRREGKVADILEGELAITKHVIGFKKLDTTS